MQQLLNSLIMCAGQMEWLILQVFFNVYNPELFIVAWKITYSFYFISHILYFYSLSDYYSCSSS